MSVPGRFLSYHTPPLLTIFIFPKPAVPNAARPDSPDIVRRPGALPLLFIHFLLYNPDLMI